MTDRYCVVGHPVAHSRSPWIHAEFARQCAMPMDYGLRDVAPEAFEAAVRAMAAEGFSGCNVTVPNKLPALALADAATGRARRAGAANTLKFAGGRILADNTDGCGFLADLEGRLHLRVAGARILVLGAGGAARGLMPVLADSGARVAIANRTASRAQALAAEFGFAAVDLAAPGSGWDAVVNATSSSLAGASLSLPQTVWKGCRLAYDLMYAGSPTPFLQEAARQGVPISDGLGMLVEQAADSWAFWRGIRPQTAAVYAALRRLVDGV